MGATSKWHFFPRLPNESFKIPRVGTPATLGPITLCVDLWLRWDLKESCSPHRELSSDMSHATCTRGNQVNSQLLMLRHQIANLTPDLFGGHNLCFRCSNRSCEPMLDIYVSIAFQWYKFFFELNGFDPWNCPLKVRESIGNAKIHSLKLFCTLRSMKCDSRASLLAHNFASPCLRHKPKARVVTKGISYFRGYALQQHKNT